MNTKRLPSCTGAILIILVIATLETQAALITRWNFNNFTSAPSTGSGTASSVGFTSVSAVGDGWESGTLHSTDPLGSDGFNSALQVSSFSTSAANLTTGVRFNVSTIGYENIIISWDQRHSNTSSRYTRFQYTLDGQNWINGDVFACVQTVETWYNGRSVNLSAIPGADNNALFGFRLLAEYQNTATGSGTAGYVAAGTGANFSGQGTWRFDMVTISGDALTPVPEPTTWALLLFGAAFCGRRLWKILKLKSRKLRAETQSNASGALLPN